MEENLSLQFKFIPPDIWEIDGRKYRFTLVREKGLYHEITVDGEPAYRLVFWEVKDG